MKNSGLPLNINVKAVSELWVDHHIGCAALLNLLNAPYQGHFGPINSVAFHPDGKSFSTGGEDGYVRIQAFDPTYFDFELDF